MSIGAELLHCHHYRISTKPLHVLLSATGNVSAGFQTLPMMKDHRIRTPLQQPKILPLKKSASPAIAAAAGGGAGVPRPQLDLTEDNVRQVLADARVEFGQLFDTSINITGQAELAELDGPFVKISLKGRFWHKRSTVLARLGNYLKQRIPEILEVDIEDDKQLDDSPENF